MSMIIEDTRANATEIYTGKQICLAKSRSLLQEMGLPDGLLPLEDIEECGLVKDTGFIWLKQKKKTEHKFDRIGQVAQYAPEITAYIEPKKLKRVTGIKAKELFMWIVISEVHVDDTLTGKLTFKTPVGITKSFPVSAFRVSEEAEAM